MPKHEKKAPKERKKNRLRTQNHILRIEWRKSHFHNTNLVNAFWTCNSLNINIRRTRVLFAKRNAKKGRGDAKFLNFGTYFPNKKFSYNPNFFSQKRFLIFKLLVPSRRFFFTFFCKIFSLQKYFRFCALRPVIRIHIKIPSTEDIFLLIFAFFFSFLKLTFFLGVKKKENAEKKFSPATNISWPFLLVFGLGGRK